MKNSQRFIAVFIFLIIIFSFSSCSLSTAYKTYISDVPNDDGIIKDDFKNWKSSYFTKKNMPSLKKEFLGKEYDGVYSTSSTLLSYTVDNYFFNDDSGKVQGEFGIKNNGELVHYGLFNCSGVDGDDEPSVTKEDAGRMAKEIAAQYVSNIEDYKQNIADLSESLGVMMYKIDFTRNVDGFRTTELIRIGVSEKGHVVAFLAEDAGEYDHMPIIDYNRLSESIQNKIESLSQKNKVEFASFDLQRDVIRICKSPDGIFYIETKVFYTEKNQSESESELVMITQISE